MQKESGEFIVESAGKQGSNIMSAMSKANCFIVLPAESTGITIGQLAIVEPFDTLI
jgi:molybdopterin molybdotransferase